MVKKKNEGHIRWQGIGVVSTVVGHSCCYEALSTIRFACANGIYYALTVGGAAEVFLESRWKSDD